MSPSILDKIGPSQYPALQVANVNGQQIAFVDSGPVEDASKPVLLFSHGFLMDHSMFDAQVEALSNTYRCIRWDERGFGATVATEAFTYWDSADDAVGVLDHLGVQKAVFIGMSQGGYLSLRAALAHQDRVQALVLIDSEAGVDAPEILEGYCQMVNHWISKAPLGPVGEMVASLILNDPELNETWIKHWETRRHLNLQYPAGALLGREDISDRVKEITCPILSIHGTDDASISIEKAEWLQAEAQKPSGLVAVEGAAHAPNMTHAEIVNAALEEFLQTLS